MRRKPFIGMVTVALGVLMLTVPPGASAAEFTADYVDGKGDPGKIFVKGADYRLEEVLDNGGKAIIIVSNSEGFMAMVNDPQKAYQTAPLANDFILMFMPFQAPQATARYEQLPNSPYKVQAGEKTDVDGRECELKVLTADTGQELQEHLTFCYSEELSFPLEVRDLTGTMPWGSVTISNVQPGAISDDLLKIPEGYSKAE